MYNLLCLPAVTPLTYQLPSRPLHDLFHRGSSRFIAKFVFGSQKITIRQSYQFEPEEKLQVFLSASQSKTAQQCGESSLIAIDQTAVQLSGDPHKFWYFHLLNCRQSPSTLKYKLILINSKGSHLSYQKQNFAFMCLTFVLAFLMASLNTALLLKKWRTEPQLDKLQAIVTLSALSYLSGVVWELTFFYAMDSYDSELVLLDILSLMGKYIARSINVGLMIMVVTGWLLTYNYKMQVQLMVPTMGIVFLLQIMMACLDKVSESDVQKYYRNDSISGLILRITELTVLIVFLVLYCCFSSGIQGKLRGFYQRFTAVSALYLALPLALWLLAGYLKEESRFGVVHVSGECVQIILLGGMSLLVRGRRWFQYGRGSIFLPNDDKFY